MASLNLPDNGHNFYYSRKYDIGYPYLVFSELSLHMTAVVSPLNSTSTSLSANAHYYHYEASGSATGINFSVAFPPSVTASFGIDISNKYKPVPRKSNAYAKIDWGTYYEELDNFLNH